MDTAIWVAVISAGAATVSGFLVWRSSGRATDVNERNADLAWVKEIRQDAIDARKEVDALQSQLRTVSRQMEAMQKEAEYWITQYQLVHRTAWRPGMTLDRLRELLGPDAPRTPATGT